MGITPEMIDITADQDAYDRIVGLGYRQVPVVVARDDHWSGFRPDKIASVVDRLDAEPASACSRR